MEPASINPPAPTSTFGRLVRLLRNLAALGLFTLGFGVLALWVRSYFVRDMVYRYDFSTSCHWAFESTDGHLGYHSNWPEDCHGGRVSYMTSEVKEWPPLFNNPGISIEGFGFAYQSNRSNVLTYGTHWPIALVLAALAFALKPKPRLKFSLADLLVLTTFSAALIAGVARLTRLAS